MLTLERPSLKLHPSYLEFIEDMQNNGETIWFSMVQADGETPSQFIDRQLSAETTPMPELVPETIYWACQNEIVVGRIAVRHVLTDKLREFGGNIGYEVAPRFRRKGYAKEMLRLILATPKAIELEKVLLTCSPDNIGSNKTIIANGGTLEKTAFVKKWNRETNYYWIITNESN